MNVILIYKIENGERERYEAFDNEVYAVKEMYRLHKKGIRYDTEENELNCFDDETREWIENNL